MVNIVDHSISKLALQTAVTVVLAAKNYFIIYSLKVKLTANLCERREKPS